MEGASGCSTPLGTFHRIFGVSMKALWVFLFGMVVDFSTTENPSRLQRKTQTLKTLKTVKSNFDKFNSSIAFALSFKWAWTMWTMWTVSKTENGFWEYDSYLCNRNIAMKTQLRMTNIDYPICIWDIYTAELSFFAFIFTFLKERITIYTRFPT